MTKLIIAAGSTFLWFGSHGQGAEKEMVTERERPAEWKNLVPGGQFKDLFEPMPIMQPLTSDTWGGDNVKPRDVSNGIEDPEWSYWGGNAIKGDDGRYHLFTVRWPESHPKGHFGYFDSFLVHAVSKDPMGPYVFQQTIGPGHNTDLYQTKNGEYIIYVIGKAYRSKSLDGPWKENSLIFDKRERYAFKNFVNFSFAPRSDGSFIGVSRRGYIWASSDGLQKYSEVSAESIYPKVEGIFEDPVMWRDEVQYNIIVNDWVGRVAYHLRSLDGFHWKTEAGEAYAPGISRYEDGTTSEWYKYERIRFLQDDRGRPIQAHFAVIDCEKKADLPNDGHNSKHLIIPLTKARLISLQNTIAINSKTKTLRVRIKAEEGFDPHTDIDLKSLRFGASEAVNYGRGSQLLATKRDNNDLILTFDGKGHGFTSDNYAGKLLGRTSEGEILFGWCRLPNVVDKVAMLSPLAPVFENTDEGLEAYVVVQNFGEMASTNSKLTVLLGDKDSDEVLATGRIRALKPFEKSLVRLVCNKSLAKGHKVKVTTLVECPGVLAESFTLQVAVPRN